MNLFIAGTRVEDKRKRWDQGRNYFTYLINKPLFAFVIQSSIAVIARHDGWWNKTTHTRAGKTWKKQQQQKKNKNTLTLESNCRKEKWAGKNNKGGRRERAKKPPVSSPFFRSSAFFPPWCSLSRTTLSPKPGYLELAKRRLGLD